MSNALVHIKQKQAIIMRLKRLPTLQSLGCVAHKNGLFLRSAYVGILLPARLFTDNINYSTKQ